MKGIIKLMLPLALVMMLSGCVQETKEKESKSEHMKITKEIFGLVGTDTAFLYTLTNDNGMSVKITNYGGIVTSIITPDKDGKLADVVLGFDDLQSYLDGHPYFGCIVGRYGNRIANGRFTIDGIEYSLAQNNDMNHLHGGIKGFDKVIWESRSRAFEDKAAVRLRYTSIDGEEGYPGNLKVLVSYMLTNDNELQIQYKATTDKATPVNLTHHSYFNLGGTQENALDHMLTIAAHQYVEVNENLIPTGNLKDVDGTPMDFSNSKHSIGERIADVEGGYDQYLCALQYG